MQYLSSSQKLQAFLVGGSIAGFMYSLGDHKGKLLISTINVIHDFAVMAFFGNSYPKSVVGYLFGKNIFMASAAKKILDDKKIEQLQICAGFSFACFFIGAGLDTVSIYFGLSKKLTQILV